MGDISRRRMLAASGQVAIAAGAGLALAGSELPGPADAATRRASGRPAPREPDWAGLRRLLRGRLLRPGDPGYEQAGLPYNRRYAGIRPGGIAVCAGAPDAAAALLWAREQDVEFAVRSGGHSYAGYSASRGLVISMSAINSIQVDKDLMTVTAGPGALNREMRAAMAGTGIAVPGGRCPTVALGGLLLGGGFGFSSRHWGLTCDQLLETEVVTAGGRILRVSRRCHPDLFWACQGGGGGNFGINTGFVLRAHPVRNVSVYRIDWPWQQAREAMKAMLDRMLTAPAAMSCRIGADVSGGGHATGGPAVRGVSALGLLFGPAGELRELLAPVLAAAPARSVLTGERDYASAQAFLARDVPAGSFASKSRFLSHALPDAGIETVVRWAEHWPGSSNPDGGGATIFAWGGAIGQVPAGTTAFVHRTPAFLMDNETTWTARDTPRTRSANLDWLAGIYAALTPYGTAQAYQNFTDPALRDWASAYYGSNLPRLRAIKRAYDPDDVFRFPQSIREARPPDGPGLIPAGPLVLPVPAGDYRVSAAT
jgi:FAD/FMN-containing dehydrogenase